MRSLEQAQQQKYKEWESTNEELRAKLSEAKKVDKDELNARIKALEDEVSKKQSNTHRDVAQTNATFGNPRFVRAPLVAARG